MAKATKAGPNTVANSADPDQTPPIGAVRPRSTLFAYDI